MSHGNKQKVKFLTVVWRGVYIRRFCELSLPSFVAPGNIPALAEGRDFEVLIMTRSEDFGLFDLYPAMARLRETCPVRFVAIDDLMDSSVSRIVNVESVSPWHYGTGRIRYLRSGSSDLVAPREITARM
jgi:hypothetical protein